MTDPITPPQWKGRTGREGIVTSWEIRSGGVRLVVANDRIGWEGRWVMHCSALGIDAKPLAPGITKERAQRRALKTAKIYALDILHSIEEME
jgi:hypothetical protein